MCRLFDRLVYLFLLSISVSISCGNLGLDEDDMYDSGCWETMPVADDIYWSPVWHPSCEVIGFNHIPLIGISFPFGEKCPGEYKFDNSLIGFWLINVDGTNKRRVLPYTLDNPVWSPDGEWIAFTYRFSDMVKMRFTETNFDTTTLTELAYGGFFPTWSPNGEWIAYDTHIESPTGFSCIWKMRADGSEKTLLAYSPTGGDTRMPSWSPTGQRIAFIHYPGGTAGSDSEIYTMDSSGSDWRRLTFNNDMDSQPLYSPGGNIIAYLSQPTATKPPYPQLWLMNSNGSGQRQLTTEGVGADFPAFSWDPSGQLLAYSSYRPKQWSVNNSVLWIILVLTGTRWQLTYNNLDEP